MTDTLQCVQVLEEMGVRGRTELDKLIEDIHMIVVNKVDECIPDNIVRDVERHHRREKVCSQRDLCQKCCGHLIYIVVARRIGVI